MNPFERFTRIFIFSLLATLLTVSSISALAQFFLKYCTKFGAFGYSGLAVYASVFIALVYFCSKPHTAACERMLASWILGITFLLKIVFVTIWSHLSQRSDSLYLLQFVDRWVAGGGEALRQLSCEVYDYPLWSGRAWPFLYPLRVLFPTQFIFATQVFNCALSTTLLAAIYGTTRHLVTRPLLPLAFAVLSPVFFWSVLDYSYRYQGALLILTALALIRFLLCESEERWRTLLASTLLGMTLFLLHLQQGLDLIVITLLLATLAYSAWQQRFTRHFLHRVLFALTLPVAIMLPLSKTTDHWFATHNQGKLSSGFIGHMAIGWNLITWGEFYWPIVELDMQTPPEQKNKAMLGYIQQQICEHPLDALIRLPFVKVIKLFQLGASNVTEKTFEERGETRWAAAFKASRFVFTPVVLLLAALGSRRFLGLAEPERLMWILLILDFAVAYTFFSEVSPHYSFYFQFVLLACAAEGVTTLCNFFTKLRQPDIQLITIHSNSARR